MKNEKGCCVGCNKCGCARSANRSKLVKDIKKLHSGFGRLEEYEIADRTLEDWSLRELDNKLLELTVEKAYAKYILDGEREYKALKMREYVEDLISRKRNKR
jgi:hypothetical protein